MTKDRDKEHSSQKPQRFLRTAPLYCQLPTLNTQLQTRQQYILTNWSLTLRIFNWRGRLLVKLAMSESVKRWKSSSSNPASTNTQNRWTSSENYQIAQSIWPALVNYYSIPQCCICLIPVLILIYQWWLLCMPALLTNPKQREEYQKILKTIWK